MTTAKRLYLYGVMGAALVPLLWGLTSLLRLLVRAAAASIGSREMVGADVIRDDLSLALALVLVAVPIWLVHAWLVRRSMSGSGEAAVDERSSGPRSAYFFVVLVITGSVATLQLYEIIQQLAGQVLVGYRVWGLAGATAAFVVLGSAWLSHIWWRRADFRVAPARTADDWLTRAYLYAGLFIVAVAAVSWVGTIASIIAGELVESRAIWESWQSWQDALVSPLAGALAASLAWSVQWLVAARLLRAEPPLGTAHRASRTRTGYFLAMVLISATAVLLLVSSSLMQALAEVLGVWRPNEGSRWLEDVGGPLVMAAPYAVAWWWHWRRSAGEALAFGSEQRRTAVLRSSRLVVTFVGLAGLSIGLAWSLFALLEYLEPSGRTLFATSVLREQVTPALAAALVGLLMWVPTWRRSQAARAREPLAVAASTSRRIYLLAVSGLAIAALMAALAALVYQATRVLLDAGPVGDVSWAAAVLLVAVVVLAYHLLQLRSDGVLVARSTATDRIEAGTAGLDPNVAETLEITAPAGADFKALNAVIRAGLPDGYALRVVNSPDMAARVGSE
jgi:hypothetical protein